MSLLFWAACFAFAPPPGEVESGPKVGEKVAALDVFAVVGDVEDKRVDIAKGRKDRPTIYVFVNAEKWDRPLARFLRKLDEEVAGAKNRSTVVAVWISPDVEKSKDYLPIAQQSLKFEHTALCVSAEPIVSPPGWEINAEAAATIVVAYGGVVKASFGYSSANETDVRKVVAAWKKADAKKAPETKKPTADKSSAPSR